MKSSLTRHVICGGHFHINMRPAELLIHYSTRDNVLGERNIRVVRF